MVEEEVYEVQCDDLTDPEGDDEAPVSITDFNNPLQVANIDGMVVNPGDLINYDLDIIEEEREAQQKIDTETNDDKPFDIPF